MPTVAILNGKAIQCSLFVISDFPDHATFRQNRVKTGLVDKLRPPLDKKLFPVDRPSGLTRADWNFFFIVFEKKFFFPLCLLCVLVNRQMKRRGKKISRPPDWPFAGAVGGQETIFYLRVALEVSSL